MSFLHCVARLTFTSLLFLSLFSTLYLYLYPIFHRCAFPTTQKSQDDDFVSTIKQHLLPRREVDHAVPFRLLALGDPQLEGDTSLHPPPPLRSRFERLNEGDDGSFLEYVKQSAALLLDHTIKTLKVYRKQIDLVGNDLYLGHIYRTLHWWTRPTHVSVLGDLIGSQWISDEEFNRRGWRYWNRVFTNAMRVEDEIMNNSTVEELGMDLRWQRRLINIAGNHDIGYAGDITRHRMDRFERMFGKGNWDIWFQYNASHEGLSPRLRVVVLNDLNLDTPAIDKDLQMDTYNFVNHVITSSEPVEDRTVATIVLTHVPLYKNAGICVDSPYFTFHEPDVGGGVREQNQLSYEASRGILEGVFGMNPDPNSPGHGLGRPGLIINGHDHEGCDVYHHIPDMNRNNDKYWKAVRWNESASLVDETIPGIREITLRSMMGDFGGYAGLLSGWFNTSRNEWEFSFSTCSVGKPLLWWAVHIIDLVVVILSILSLHTKSGKELLNGQVELKDVKAAADSSTK